MRSALEPERAGATKGVLIVVRRFGAHEIALQEQKVESNMAF
jgi:hypothetical protein